MTDLTVFREYEPFECGDDGYPLVWHSGAGLWRKAAREGDPPELVPRKRLNDAEQRIAFGVKHLVRAEADHRCVRCGHPYMVGTSGQIEEEERLAEDPELSRMLDLFGNAEGSTETDPRPRIHWSPCDERCTHDGPIRMREPTGDGWVQLTDEQMRQQTRQARDYVREDKVVEAAWRILTVHHLNERKHDLRWWNLASLCQRCHLYIQRKVVMDRSWPWDHTDWFKPHAAAWYAYKYRGLTLTKAETLTMLPELLELGKREESVERMPL